MAFTPEQILDITEVMQQFLEKRRPPEHIRPQLDYDYRIDGQSITIVSIRPWWNDPSRTMEEPIAKATYVKTTDQWKVYWMRGNLKWYPYDPRPTVTDLRAFTKLVLEDRHCCFFG